MSNEYSAGESSFSVKDLLSLVNIAQYDNLENAWQKVVESNNKNIQALLEVVDLLAKREERKRAHDLLAMLVPHYKQKGLYQDVLTVLKRLLEYNPKEKGLAKDISECYSNLYGSRVYANALIDRTGINGEGDVRDAVKKLETYFCLDVGDYVFHKSWGVGQVCAIDAEGEKVVIDFEKKSNHSIAMDIVATILQKLERDDLLVMIYARKEELQKMVEEDPVSLVKLTLKYFKGKTLVSNLKGRITSGVMPVEAWSKWWTNVRKLLKKDPYIKFIEGTPSTTAIAFRDIPVTHHSDILEKLAGVRDLDNKIEITKKYITGMKDTEVCKDTLTEITNLFDKEAETYSVTNPAAAIECCLLLEEIQLLLQGERGKYTSRIETFVRDGINIPETINKINILDYRKQALGIVKKVSAEKWPEEFSSVFFMNDGNLWEFIVKDLTAENKQSAVEAITHKLFNQFNAFPEHYIWFCKNGMQGRFAELYQNIDPSILFCRLIELLDNMGFKIQKGRNGNLKTISNKIKNLLEDKGVAYATSIVNDANAESIFDIISSSKCLEDWFKVAVENLIRDRFPDLFEVPGLPTIDDSKIYVTQVGYEKRKKEFDHLMNVEFTENARDLGEAISRGDLRENAEYKAAREKQAMLVEKAERLKAELQKVVIIDPRFIQTDTIVPGSKVTVRCDAKIELDVYTLLGPWDVDIEKGIISYLSPIGRGLFNKKVGDIVSIKLPEGASSYEVIKIEAIS